LTAIKPFHLKQTDIHFTLFACCIPVKGVRRAVIYDLQRGKFKYIPLEFYDLLQLTPVKTVAAVKAVYGEGSERVVDDFFNVLATEQWGFYTREPGLYPPLNMNWDFPSVITNCVAEYSQTISQWSLPALLAQLEQLQTWVLHLRLFDVSSMETITGLLPYWKHSALSSVELMVNWFPEADTGALLEMLMSEHRITKLIMHGIPGGTKIETSGRYAQFYSSRTLFTSQRFNPGDVAEKVKFESFVVNTEFFTEARNFNTGLNRKMAVDVNGNIKNHISHNRVLGNMQTGSLLQAVEQHHLNNTWSVNNDHIVKCRGCEYRYMCMDNSEVVMRDGEWYKTADCGYNPETTAWQT
jgi:SPASM domain peptide maturase of grasp-with-spasm system